MRRLPGTVFALLAIGLIAQAPAFGGTTWDPAADYTGTNPGDAWSYGWVSYDDFTAGGYLLTVFDTLRDWDSMDHWGVAEGTEPAVLYNPTEDSHWFGNEVPPETMALHPGGDGQYAIIRWTAPEAGTFTVTGSFFTFDWPSVDTHVLLNGTSFFDSTLSEPGSNPFDLLVSVAAGDTIDFAVGNGGNGHGGDATNFEAQIGPVPEPGSLLAVGCGLLGLLALKRRKK
jgi:hypothetical protein